MLPRCVACYEPGERAMALLPVTLTRPAAMAKRGSLSRRAGLPVGVAAPGRNVVGACCHGGGGPGCWDRRGADPESRFIKLASPQPGGLRSRCQGPAGPAGSGATVTPLSATQ
jgi:hypothetical protein